MTWLVAVHAQGQRVLSAWPLTYICEVSDCFQVFNGCVITAAERATAQEMFQPLQAARTAASNTPVVSLVGSALHCARLYKGFFFVVIPGQAFACMHDHNSNA